MKTLCVFLFLGLLHTSALAAKPNVILVFIDDMGWGDFSCFGNEAAQTPEVDRMAKEGIRFEQFYVNSPICSPSRTAISTGQYPQRWKITSYLSNRDHNQQRGMAQWLDPKAPMLARSLQKAGYATGHFGKWHMGGQRNVDDAPAITDYGFDASLTNFEGMGPKLLPLTLKPGQDPNKPGRIWGDAERLGKGVRWMQRSKITEGFVDEAIPFMKKAAEAKKPFYVNLWPDDVHSPFWPPVDKWGNGKRELYLQVLREMDRQFGKLFDFVRDDDTLRENTLVLICSDNGPELGAGVAGPFRGYKTHLYEGGVRSSLIAWGPGLIPSNNNESTGKVNGKSVFSAVDLVPTLLDLADVPHPKGIKYDGESLPDVLLGKSNASRKQPLLFRRPPDRDAYYGDNDLPDLAIREGKWKFLCEYDGTDAELYDMEKDRGETKNLADKHPELVARLTKVCIDWHKSLPPDNGPSMIHKPKKRTKKSAFDLKQGENLSGGEAPFCEGRKVTIRAKFESQGKDGVILAQGGDKAGYSLYIRDGKLVLGVRRDWKLTEAVAASSLEGSIAVVATIGRTGKMTISVAGKQVAAADAKGKLTQPGDGLQVGNDLIKPVGKYTTTKFPGTITKLSLKFD
ncbi:MAG: N-acetylgalactosamine-6-sulfatase [Opitutae bacterium]|nr:N-acetylgalactosamine-6-sulfatase [Opitutae bacterium]|tara:strand:+ start:911 stop:2785 length:1875 start_codon:yes stop_codon:yes gene_type:complete